MTETSRALRIQALIAFMCLALLLYLVLLGRTAVILISSQRIAGIALGVALLILPVVGLWAMIVTLRAGFTHQRLARAYDYAGDRRRAREAMKKAVVLQGRS